MKEYKPCSTCADTITGIPHGIVGTVDLQTGSNKLDPVYNTTVDCPKDHALSDDFLRLETRFFRPVYALRAVFLL